MLSTRFARETRTCFELPSLLVVLFLVRMVSAICKVLSRLLWHKKWRSRKDVFEGIKTAAFFPTSIKWLPTKCKKLTAFSGHFSWHAINCDSTKCWYKTAMSNRYSSSANQSLLYNSLKLIKIVAVRLSQRARSNAGSFQDDDSVNFGQRFWKKLCMFAFSCGVLLE